MNTAIVHAGAGLPREAGYVATSRARNGTHLHLSAQTEPIDGPEHGHCGPPPDHSSDDDPRQRLAAALHRSQAQDLAVSLDR